RQVAVDQRVLRRRLAYRSTGVAVCILVVAHKTIHLFFADPGQKSPTGFSIFAGEGQKTSQLFSPLRTRAKNPHLVFRPLPAKTKKPRSFSSVSGQNWPNRRGLSGFRYPKFRRD